MVEAFDEFLMNSRSETALRGDGLHPADEEDEFSLENGETNLLAPFNDDEEIQWISNDKHIHIENNYEEPNRLSIHLKIGVNKEFGDALIYRNVLSVEDSEEFEETDIFSFKREEAEYLLGFIQDYISYMDGQHQ